MTFVVLLASSSLVHRRHLRYRPHRALFPRHRPLVVVVVRSMHQSRFHVHPNRLLELPADLVRLRLQHVDALVDALLAAELRPVDLALAAPADLVLAVM
eukprot:9432911-Pyramimonas_sp.AAC.1